MILFLIWNLIGWNLSCDKVIVIPETFQSALVKGRKIYLYKDPPKVSVLRQL